MPSGTEERFSNGEASGYSALLTLLLVAVLFESVPAHFLISRWSRAAAWICTALSAYALLWLVAALRGLRSRPILITGETLILRLGSLWRIDIPRNAIANFTRATRSQPGAIHADGLSLVKWNLPQWQIEFHQPLAAHGPYGLRKTVRRVSFSVDDPARFDAAMSHFRSDNEGQTPQCADPPPPSPVQS